MPVLPYRGSANSNATSSCFPVKATLASVSVKGVDSPDNDSAFSDNGSMLSNESSTTSSSGNKQSKTKGANQPNITTTTSTPANPLLGPEKGLSVQKLCVKIFCADGSTKSILLDHVMTAGNVLDILVEKNHVQLQPSWAIVEHLPELLMERSLEDHENVLDLLSTWRAEAKNKLLFIPRPERYDIFRRPEKYLLGTSNVTQTADKKLQAHQQQQQQQQHWDQQSRQALLQDIFCPEDQEESSSVSSSLEMEGFLYLKAEGKKNWKKHHFLLLSTGLYYAPKSCKNKGSSEKELVCLVSSLDVNLIYYGISWKKKFKAPTDFCFALRPPNVQMKGAKEIRYLCAENEAVLQQWMAVLRILKNQRMLLENYNCLLAKMYTGTGKEGLYAALRQKEEEVNSMILANLDDSRVEQSNPCEVSTTSYCSDEIFSSASSSLPANSSSSNMSDASFLSTSSNNSVSSGCVSETSSISEHEAASAGFDADYPDGGTIKRKPTSSQQKITDHESAGELTPTKERIMGVVDITDTIRRKVNLESAPTTTATTNGPTILPPPPSDLEVLGGNLTVNKLGGSDVSLNSLPPPPEELRFPQRFPANFHLQHMNFVSGGTTSHQQENSIPYNPHLVQQQLQLQNQRCQQEYPHQRLSNIVSNGCNSNNITMGANAQINLHSCIPTHSLQQQQQHRHQEAVVDDMNLNGQIEIRNGRNLINQQQQQQSEALANIEDVSYGNSAIREQLYPCGVFRSVFPRNEPESQTNLPTSQQQMALLKQMPNNPPPRPFQTNGANPMIDINTTGLPIYHQRQQPTNLNSTPKPRKRKITFNERVQHIFMTSTEPLKGGEGGNKSSSTDIMEEDGFFFPSSTIRNPNPGRLFENQPTKTTDAIPPRAFLNDLQRVMQKKWAVAQKFHFGSLNQNDKTKRQNHEEASERFANHYNEQEISKWILQSLKHSHVEPETDMSQDLYDIQGSQQQLLYQQQQQQLQQHQQPAQLLMSHQEALSVLIENGAAAFKQQLSLHQQRVVSPPCTLNIAAYNNNNNNNNNNQRPKIYNGRSVPNCFPPSSPPGNSSTKDLSQLQDSLKRVPPQPPRRNGATQLTSPR